MIWFMIFAVLVAVPLCHHLSVRREARRAERAAIESFAIAVEFNLIVRDSD